MPAERIEDGSWPHPARLPLGGGWSGHCTAPGHERQIPSRDVLEAFCNLGYACGCTWAPQERNWDAVRFAVSAPGAPVTTNYANAGNGSGRLLSLRYVCERDHRPVEHGQLQFDTAQSEWLKRHVDARIQKMAECFLESYFRKKAPAEV